MSLPSKSVSEASSAQKSEPNKLQALNDIFKGVNLKDEQELDSFIMKLNEKNFN